MNTVDVWCVMASLLMSRYDLRRGCIKMLSSRKFKIKLLLFFYTRDEVASFIFDASTGNQN
jgi:hypothetical protein